MSSKAAERASKRAQLEALKLARITGKRDYKAEEKTIYDEVDDEDYQAIVKGRLQEDDFIEEDSGVTSGYADNGMDDWDRERSTSDESDDEQDNGTRRANKRAKKEAKKAASMNAAKKRAQQRANMPSIAPGANPYLNPNRKSDTNKKMGLPLPEQEDDFMKSLLGDLEDQAEMNPAPCGGPSSIANNSSMKPKVTLNTRPTVRIAKPSTYARNGYRTSTSTTDFADSSDIGGVETGPSSDGTGYVKIEDADEQDMGGMDILEFDNLGRDTMTLQKGTTELKQEEDIDGDDDEDEVLLRPNRDPPGAAATGGINSGKIKISGAPTRQRQLVNGAATKAKPLASALKSEVKKEEEETTDLPLNPLQTMNVPINNYSIATDAKSRPKGMDWRTAAANLAATASIAAPLYNVDEAMMLESKLASDENNPLPLPESLKRQQKKVGPAPIVMGHVNALDDDGSTLRFWWYDYFDNEDSVFLIGKVKARSGTKDEGKWVSACVTVSGIRRKLYVLPRAKAIDSDGNEIDEEDDSPPEFDDVEMDFVQDAEEKYGATGIEVTPGWVSKSYAFGVKGIPRETSHWMEVITDFPSKMSEKGEKIDIPLEASGERYSHVFGTNTNAFERFVIDRKIMGPCWLNMKNVKLSQKEISWTKFEAECNVDDVHTFSTDDESAPRAAPPLTIMSLSIRTVINLSDNRREIVCASTRIWQDSSIDDVMPIEKQPSSVTTLVRNLFTPFPQGFEAAARATKSPGSRGSPIIPFKEEKPLLAQLLAIIFRNDPDVIVGHDFSTLGLDVLLNRMKDLKIDHWSRISRFRRPRWPKLNPNRNAHVISGRLICDLSSDVLKSFIDSTTWSLTEMCGTHLKIEREDFDPEDTPKYFDNVHSTAAQLLHFVLHCEADCYFQMALAFKVQALLLTRQLTNLAGNAWSRTLNSANRAERNEYILLHRFNEKGFVCPDKIPTWKKRDDAAKEAKLAKLSAEAAGEEEITIVAKKEKFKGGLVFEPTKGLWDRYVLVMDFNSLYPSIIQEYDVDFSTIDWTADDAEDLEKMPERSPCEGPPQGVLPQLIASLVERRRNVKALMKEKGTSASKLLQYDITQKALKLTANSMYGCLGFEGSRFYARPLAALTTFKGREILTRTKADAESLNLDVIYGDTDSVMINTNQLELAAALKIGSDFKKLINEKYKKLEIDIDHVFERLLLLQKKKYAALVVEEDGSRTVEVKGLDMKRREYSELSKDASKYVLERILSGEPTELVVEQIHEYLISLGENVRSGLVPVDKYIIFKRLGKNPNEYPDAKAQPHVQVALKMTSKGQSAKAGDVIPYIFCMPQEADGSKGAKAGNAYHPDDVRRTGSTLKIDFEVYLSTQVLPPIERLCEHIDGTEKARLAECLGLDVTRYKNTNLDLPERDFRTLQSQIPDIERFKEADPLRFRCRNCSSEAVFDGISNNVAGLITKSGIYCSNDECGQPLAVASMTVQLELQIRSFIAKFYEGWLICDDSSCHHRTRMMSVYGKRCLASPCRGQMHFEYSDGMLYTQLLYIDSLFDIEKARSKAAGSPQQDETIALIDSNKVVLSLLRAVVQRHLNKNGRRWVSMTSLFSFMAPKHY